MPKRIDFHIHTLSSKKDEPFDFSLDWLKKYVEHAKLDAIAITNHDLFDKENFEKIKKTLNSTAVYPGMEISLDIGHVNVVFSHEHVGELAKFSDWIKSYEGDHIKCAEMIDELTCWKEGLYILEYGKSQGVNTVPDELSGATVVLGVNNQFRFNKLKQAGSSLAPVLFSDAHATNISSDPKRNDIKILQNKNTYIQADNCEFSDIKNAISDTSKVSINKDGLQDVIEINGVKLSTGLNLVVGKRGTGKTVFLKSVIENNDDDDIYYIEQFATANPSEYINRQRREQGQMAIKSWRANYSKQFESIADYIDDNHNEDNLDDYLESVKKYAQNVEAAKEKDQIILFTENIYSINSIGYLVNPLKSMYELINNKELWELLEDGQDRKKYLEETYGELRKICTKKYIQEELKSKYVNSLIDEVKSIIALKTGTPTITDCDLSKIVRKRQTENKIQDFLEKIIVKTKERQENIYGYQLIIDMVPFSNAEEFRKEQGIKGAVKNDLIKPYLQKEYIKFVNNLKEKVFYNRSKIAEYFMRKDIQLLDPDGTPASGGQEVGFALAMRLEEAKKKSVILIDEPEASLDNAYIKGELNKALKELSTNSMVVVVTHNSTLGTLLNPDYLVVTSKDENGEYHARSGEFTSGKISGDDKSNEEASYDKFIEAMESGIESYKKKGKVYENLKNKK